MKQMNNHLKESSSHAWYDIYLNVNEEKEIHADTLYVRSQEKMHLSCCG